MKYSLFTVLLILSALISIPVSHGEAQDFTKFEVILTLEGFNGMVEDIAWNTNGNFLAGSGLGGVIIWNAKNGEIFTRIDFERGYNSDQIAWDPDGRKLAYCGANSTLIIMDIYSGSEEFGPRISQGAIALTWNPTGDIILASTRKGPLVIWNLTSRTHIEKITGHPGLVNSIDFSPNGSYFATCEGGSSEYTIKIWDTNLIQVINNLTGHTDAVRSVSWHPNGYYLASGSIDSTVRIWNATTGETVWINRPYNFPLDNTVSWDPNGTYLASAADSKLHIWDISMNETIAILNSSYPYPIAWNPNGLEIATAGTIIYSDSGPIFPVMIYGIPVNVKNSDSRDIYYYIWFSAFLVVTIATIVIFIIVWYRHKDREESE